MSNETPRARAQEWVTKAKNAIEPWQYLGALALLITGAIAALLAKATPFLMMFAPASLILVVCFTWLLVIACAWLALAFTQSVFGWPRRRAASLAPSMSSNPITSAEAPVSQRAWQRPPLDLRAWRRIDSMSLSQAAYLWNDREPPAGTAPGLLPEVFATFQMLLSAIEKGELKMKRAGSSELDIVVTREDLADYAARHGDKPKFLTEAD